jgi:RHS repeat-associated protein
MPALFRFKSRAYALPMIDVMSLDSDILTFKDVLNQKADAAGNTIGYASNTYSFNDRGRMSEVIVSGIATNYVYNALGQLIEKSGNGGTILFMYDESGHILGEYSSTGALIEETIWLGDTPVATLRPSGSTIAIYYVHSDHLGTVRKVTRPSDNGLMWRWDPDTFGSVAANSNPAGLGTFTYNLGFPGQYFLTESGLYYNYFRDYDPTMGRYIESDPIGLGSGVNTYAYGNGNPITNSDPTGLRPPTPAEAQFMQQYFGPCINPQKLDIKVRKWGDTSRALSLGGGFMSFPSSYGWTPPSDPPHGLFLSTVPWGKIPGKSSKPGCLASTLYHELLHTTGLVYDTPTATEPPAAALEGKCIGNLCK